jgi:dihydroorotase
VDNQERLESYRASIHAASAGRLFEPYMTLFFKAYDEPTLRSLKAHIIGIKLYPAGVTTHSEAGVQTIEDAIPTLALMQELAIPLLVHGETHGFVLDREREFLMVYDRLARRFPRLTHITTREAVAFLDRYPNVYATVTLHHLLYTLDDIAGGLLQPHLFCKPLAKRPEDRDALLATALSAHPKLMFGSDSAPHPQSAKECSGCAAGVFTAPIALPCLVELFEQHHALDRLQAFVSDNARRIYDIQPPARVVELEKTPWVVPERYGTVIPMHAGETLAWQVVAP